MRFIFRFYQFIIISISIILCTSMWTCNFFQGDEENNHSEIYPLILISMDGFRWDYTERTDTPNFDILIEKGARAQSLIPVFPTSTFPNHLSIVTGLYPENHGIISNTMYDDVFDAWYKIGEGSESVLESRWYEGEPIWVTAEKQGKVSATYFWPGSEAEINGKRPTYWYVFDPSTSNETIIDQLLAWLDLPEGERPVFMMAYFYDADHWGHNLGPEAEGMDTIIQGLDLDLGRLIAGLTARDLLDKVNIIITADHGMVEIDRERMIFLDDYIDLADVTMVRWSPVAGIIPNEGLEDSIYNLLVNVHPQLSVYKKEETPEHLHYRNHRRITPIIGIADEGWSISTRDYYNSNPESNTGGTHGYDPAFLSMHGIFLAYGPAFKDGLIVPSFQNIHIYELIANVLGIEPAVTDGSLDSVSAMLE